MFCLFLLAGAASAVSPAAKLKSNYELALQAERLTEAVVGNNSRDIYRMFTPGFVAENSFASFDSAFTRWYRGRRIVRASHKVVDIEGPSGHVSSWFVFEGEHDYNYVYQNWLNTPDGWQLAATRDSRTVMLNVQPPAGDEKGPLKVQVANIDYNDYVGRIAIGRI